MNTIAEEGVLTLKIQGAICVVKETRVHRCCSVVFEHKDKSLTSNELFKMTFKALLSSHAVKMSLKNTCLYYLCEDCHWPNALRVGQVQSFKAEFEPGFVFHRAETALTEGRGTPGNSVVYL